MNNKEYGPLAFLIGKWKSEGYLGQNKAPDPNRDEENTSFRQETVFEPIGQIDNHEQFLFVLKYNTLAWEEGNEEDPFHQEVGYWIWDPSARQIIKSFIVPRGISVNAGGTAEENAMSFVLQARVGDEVYGICSNKFLDEEFKSIEYILKIEKLDENTFRYEEDTLIKIKGKKDIFHHTEKNTLQKI